MNTYPILIEEILGRVELVKANSEEEALAMVSEAWSNEDIVLNDTDFQDVHFMLQED